MLTNDIAGQAVILYSMGNPDGIFQTIVDKKGTVRPCKVQAHGSKFYISTGRQSFVIDHILVCRLAGNTVGWALGHDLFLE